MYHYYVEFWDELDQKNRSDSGLTWGATYGDAANRVVEYYGLENISTIQLEKWESVMPEEFLFDGFVHEVEGE